MLAFVKDAATPGVILMSVYDARTRAHRATKDLDVSISDFVIEILRATLRPIWRDAA